ncbi:MAG: sulfatase [Candidatus Abyssubacteria bacterium]
MHTSGIQAFRKSSPISSLLRALMSAILIGGVVAFATCSALDSEERDNVVLIIIDTIRPDRLGCYGYSLPTSPNIDRFASEGTLFTQAVTCAPVTLPSVSAILTSTYPVFNNVRYNGLFFLDDSALTLAEILKERGYTTAAFIGAFPLDSRFKVNQGFEVYDADFSDSVKNAERTWIGHEVKGFERTAAEVNERAIPWLSKNRDKRFFLMVHYFDPHWPHESPSPEYAEKFKSPYNAEVAYTDEQTGRLLEAIDALGLRENTLVVLTGDHGEGLGAHGELTHGTYIFDTTVLIPLILRHPNRIPQGSTVEHMVRSIDIMPTILDFLRIPAGPHTQGTSLLPALKGEFQSQPILLETHLPYYESGDTGHLPMKVSGLRTQEWKLVYATGEKDGQPFHVAELYNVKKEPLELFNVAQQNPETFSRLMNDMNALIQKHSVGAVTSNSFGEMDDETRQKLRSLGYLK